MAKIPRLNEIDAIGNTRRVVSVQAPEIAGAATGRALSELGQTIGDIQYRTEKAKQDTDIALTDIKAREALDKARREIENDPSIDPTTYEKVWTEKSKAVLDQFGAPLKSNYAAKIWQERAAGYQAEGTIQIRDTQRKRQIEGVNASLIEAGTAYERQAQDIAIPEAEVAKTREAYEAIIKTQYDNGLIGKDDMALKLAKSDAVAIAGKTTRVSSNIDALVKEGRIAEARAMLTNNASLIDPQTRDALNKTLDESEFNQVTVTKGDDLWTQAKGDLGAYMKLAAKEPNAKLRLSLEDRGAKLDAIKAKAEADDVQAAQQLLWKHVLSGGTVDNASPSVLVATKGDIGFARAFVSARDAEATMSKSEKAALEADSNTARLGFEAFARTNPAAFMGDMKSWHPQLQAAYSAMTAADQLAIQGKRETMTQNGPTADATDKVLQDVTNAAKRIAPELLDTKDRNADTKFKFDGVLYDIAKELSMKQGGVPLTADQAKRAALKALAAYDTNTNGKYRITAYRETNAMTAADIMREDPIVWNKLHAALSANLGRQPNKSEVIAAYQGLMNQ